MQRGRFASPAVWSDDNLHVLIERYEEAQETLNGKLAKFTAEHF
jgi:hypothetical protein